MTDETSAPAGGEAMPVADAPVQDTGGDLSLRQAAQLLSQARRKTESAPVEQPQADPVEQDELAKANADPETAPSGEPEAIDPEETLPTIEPPRSWTKAEKERFATLPRETQDYIHAREQEREREFRRSQNEIAEQRKAVQTEREAAEKARKQYEAQLPTLMQELQDVQQDAFSDIKSMADVVKLQAEDPFRFQTWQVHQMRLQAAKAENDRVESDKSRKQQDEWTAHINEQNTRAIELIPELADEAKSSTLRERVIKEVLPDLGFTGSELNELAAGKSKLSIYDARIQRLLVDSLALKDIRNAPKAIAAKSVPPVQRPGTPKPPGSGPSAQIQALEEKFNRTGSLKDAQALHAAQSRLANRRAS